MMLTVLVHTRSLSFHLLPTAHVLLTLRGEPTSGKAAQRCCVLCHTGRRARCVV